MNERYLFRAKRIDNGEFIEGFLIFEKDRAFIAHRACEVMNSYSKSGEEYGFGNFIEVNPYTICQFTGLTDKNGKRIYENDIVSNKWCFIKGCSTVKFGEYKNINMSEKYKCGNLGFYLEHSVYEKEICRKDIMYFSGKCEVIGNIFDNKDLMEEVRDEKTD